MYASVSDVEVDFGPITDPTMQGQAEALLVRAEEQVRQLVPDLDARIASGRTTEPLVVQVLSEMVAAVLRNPEGADNRTRTVGPYSEHISYVNSRSSTSVESGLMLKAHHRVLLGERTEQAGAFTVRFTAPHRRCW